MTQWAAAFELPDPMPLASEALDCDPEALHQAFVQTRQACVGVWRGTQLVEDTWTRLAAGWSAPEPAAALGALVRAGWSTRAILVRQADQADRTRAELASCRAAMQAALDEAVSAIAGAGLPLDGGAAAAALAAGPAWSDPARPSARPIVEKFCAAATVAQAQVRSTLADLARALSVDPLQPIQGLMARSPVLARPCDRSTPQDFALQLAQEANMARLERDLSSGDTDTKTTARGIKDALEEAAARGEEATLVLYESAHGAVQARAAIAVGDLATATRTTLTVPGIFNTPADMSGALKDAGVLQAQTEWASDEETAVIAWFGYSIPGSGVLRPPSVRDSLNLFSGLSRVGSLLATADDDAAVAGGESLARDLTLFRTYMPDEVIVTGDGFSMGSTTVSQAARHAGVFDQIVLAGSPGAGEGVRSVDDYPGLDGADVWVNSLDDDPVTNAGPDVLGQVKASLTHDHGNLVPFGADPATESFGARVMDHRSPADDHGLGLGNHTSTNYLTASLLQSTVAVIVGKPDQVPVRRGR
ncbi:hypothetical protein J2S58_000150 [Nakamurella flavida]|nr:alpha/beta hydrolase [Nakamurella flavida]MDP9776527.1 hypothetical protein [Nakamurella flavida]